MANMPAIGGPGTTIGRFLTVSALLGIGAKWSKYRGLSAAKLFEEHFARFAPEYFIVAAPGEFEKQKSLKEFLYGKFKVLVHKEKYLIFDLTGPKE